jgi:translation elongation factor P/translation initiation factor 5A
MKNIARVILSIGLIACFPYAAIAASGGATTESSTVHSATVTVQSVDLSQRLLTIRYETGEERTIKVDETVRNLEQLKKGDTVMVRYTQAVAVALKPPGTGVKDVEVKEGMQRSQPGEKPGGVAGSQVRTTIKVKSVDLKKNTVTFDNFKGETRTIAVKRPEMQAYLKQLKPGDEVEITYAEEVLVKVTPPQP